MLVVKHWQFIPKVICTRTVHDRCRIGTREVVGFGVNGSYNYKDDAHFPFPSVRFREPTKESLALRIKEKCDWRQLSCEEKKALYRNSFCQTYAEFQHPTGQWKLIVGCALFGVSFGFWMTMFCHYYVFEPLPISLSEVSQKAQLMRMIDLRVNVVDGLTSHWDYVHTCWKWETPPEEDIPKEIPKDETKK